MKYRLAKYFVFQVLLSVVVLYASHLLLVIIQKWKITSLEKEMETSVT